jgi:hypothetical protein
MPKPPEKHRQVWTKEEIEQLKDLARQNTPTRVIASRLGRTREAVQSKAANEGVSLRGN